VLEAKRELRPIARSKGQSVAEADATLPDVDRTDEKEASGSLTNEHTGRETTGYPRAQVATALDLLGLPINVDLDQARTAVGDRTMDDLEMEAPILTGLCDDLVTAVGALAGLQRAVKHDRER